MYVFVVVAAVVAAVVAEDETPACVGAVVACRLPVSTCPRWSEFVHHLRLLHAFLRACCNVLA